MSNHDGRLRLLAIDGGGVRGLSALIILQQLMEAIDPDEPPKPCDYFDMIGGTSTGGLIAVMLGRLELSVDECIDAYLQLSDRIFQKKRHRVTIKGKIQGRFDSNQLEQAVKEIITKHGLQEDALLKDKPDATCKVFVCATRKHTTGIQCLTSYRTPRGNNDLLKSVKIWEACRATAAASSFFDPIAIGPYKEEFVDGATGANNPVMELWNEAQLMWGPEPVEARVQCLVSVGTGVPSLKAFQDDAFGIWETLQDLATDTEHTAEKFQRDKAYLDRTGRYFRFNVIRGLDSIGLEESKKIKEIASATREYVESQEIFKQIQACARNLTDKECRLETTSFNKHYCIPHAPSSIFVGRDQVLAQLQEGCVPAKLGSSIQRRFVLYGLGGSGKTQTCLKFAEENQERFWAIFWIDASSETTAWQGFSSIARECHIAVDPKEVMKFLTKQVKPWLLIVDNADNQSLNVAKFFPLCKHGSIILTTRNPDRRIHATVGSYELGEMGPKEAVALLLRAALIEDSVIPNILTEAAAVARLLGFLALAITQAGACIRQGLCSMTEYRALYSKHRRSLLGDHVVLSESDYNLSVYTTWDVSLEAIKSMASETSTNAVELIRVLSFLHHDGVSEEIFYRAWKSRQENDKLSNRIRSLFFVKSAEWEPLLFRAAVAQLAAFSLIKIEPEDRRMSMHPLVHTWARDSLSQDLRHEYWVAASHILVAGIKLDPRSGGRSYIRTLTSHIESCVALCEDQPIFGPWMGSGGDLQPTSRLQDFDDNRDIDLKLRIELVEKFAWALVENYEIKAACDLWREVLKVKKISGDAECHGTPNVMDRLGMDYLSMGETESALDLMGAILRVTQSTLGSKHPSTLSAMHVLANAHRQWGVELDKAKTLMEEVLEVRQETFGEEDLDTLDAMYDLAIIYQHLQQWSKAKELTKRVLKARQRIQGSKHPDALRAKENLAHIRRTFKKYPALANNSGR